MKKNNIFYRAYKKTHVHEQVNDNSTSLKTIWIRENSFTHKMAVLHRWWNSIPVHDDGEVALFTVQQWRKMSSL